MDNNGPCYAITKCWCQLVNFLMWGPCFSYILLYVGCSMQIGNYRWAYCIVNPRSACVASGTVLALFVRQSVCLLSFAVFLLHLRISMSLVSFCTRTKKWKLMEINVQSIATEKEEKAPSVFSLGLSSVIMYFFYGSSRQIGPGGINGIIVVNAVSLYLNSHWNDAVVRWRRRRRDARW